MNNIIKGNEQNRRLFRELFFSVQKSLKAKFDSVKKNYRCQRCCYCCQNRYLEISPEELQQKASQDEFWKNFSEFFVAVSEETEYSKKVKTILGDVVWFYSCKYFNGQKCTYSGKKQGFCCSGSASFDKILPDGCGYVDWQKYILDYINNEVFKDIVLKYKQLNEHRENFSCNRTGTCCKFACSEFSYEELKEKASNGDNFATQFVSVFVPYEDQEKAREIYPEYVDMLEQKLLEDEKVWFYYCPHLDKNNLCTQYDKRPDICRNFPDNPLSILPPWCGYYQWKEDVEVLAMTLQALVSLAEYYKERLEKFAK